jgi:transposase
MIDNAPAEQAIRPLAVGRRNWLQIAGDGGLTCAAVLLSIAASANRHRVNPRTYINDLLTQLPARAADADLTDLLPDIWLAPYIVSMETPVDRSTGGHLDTTGGPTCTGRQDRPSHCRRQTC